MLAQGDVMRLGVRVVGVLALTACASGLTPLQERAWDAFKDCQKQAPTAVLQQISVDGGISYRAREGDVGIMQRCLQERYGYRFH
jgi:hypothetical protein